ncbi:hypothetical protein BGW39_004632 [Mortierella sp. 14UC]|nr:hypothetical protein BGW39_004632 [Mortierella sp. 14UC]
MSSTTIRSKPCRCRGGDLIGDEYRRDLAAAKDELLLCASILAQEGEGAGGPGRSFIPQKMVFDNHDDDDEEDEDNEDDGDDENEDGEDEDEDSSNDEEGMGHSHQGIDGSDADLEVEQRVRNEHDRQRFESPFPDPIPDPKPHQSKPTTTSTTTLPPKIHHRSTYPPLPPLPPLAKPKDPPQHIYLLRMWIHSKDMADYIRQIEDFIDVMDDALHQHTFDLVKRAQKVEDIERRDRHEIEMVKAKAVFMFPTPPLTTLPPPPHASSSSHFASDSVHDRSSSQQ